MSKERFTYRRQERTADGIRAKASEGARDFDNLWKGDVKLFKPRDGENIGRILPATWGSQPFTNAELDKMSEADLRRLQEEDEKWGIDWYITVWIHYGVGPDNGMYLCLDKMLGERCPCCDAGKASRDPDEADRLKPQKRALAWWADRDSEKEGPQLWPMPWTKIRSEIYSRSTNKKDGTPLLPDGRPPDYEGYDILFNKSGKEDRTNYTGVELDRDLSPICQDEKREGKWLDYITDHPLPSLLNFFDAEHIEKVLRGRASSRRTSGEEDEDGQDAHGRRGDRRRGEDEGSSRRERFARRAQDSEKERDYLDEGSEEDEGSTRGGRSSPERDDGARTERSERGTRRSAEPEPDEEIDEGGEGTSERSSRRGTSGRTAPRDGGEPEGDPDGAPDASPTEQARSSLRSMRSRRGTR